MTVFAAYARYHDLLYCDKDYYGEVDSCKTINLSLADARTVWMDRTSVSTIGPSTSSARAACFLARG